MGSVLSGDVGMGARPEAARGIFVGPDGAPVSAFGDSPAEARARLKRARLPRFAKEIERLLNDA